MFRHLLVLSTKWTKLLLFPLLFAIKYSVMLMQVHCRWLFSFKAFTEQPRWRLLATMWPASVFHPSLLQKAAGGVIFHWNLTTAQCSCRICWQSLKSLICKFFRYCHYVIKQRSQKFKEILHQVLFGQSPFSCTLSKAFM